jgi:hypothetical protein
MKGFRRLIPGRKKTKKYGDRDLSLDSNSDHLSSEPPIDIDNPPPASLPVIPQRPGNTHDVRFNTNTTTSEDSPRTSHTNPLQMSEEMSPEVNLRQDGTSPLKEQWHTGENGNSVGNNNTTNMGDQFGAISDRIPLSRKLSVGSTQSDATVPDIFDDAPTVVMSYDAVPLLEQTKLPRGGVSMDTAAVGRVQVRNIFLFACAAQLLPSFLFSTHRSLRSLF